MQCLVPEGMWNDDNNLLRSDEDVCSNLHWLLFGGLVNVYGLCLHEAECTDCVRVRLELCKSDAECSARKYKNRNCW